MCCYAYVLERMWRARMCRQRLRGRSSTIGSWENGVWYSTTELKKQMVIELNQNAYTFSTEEYIWDNFSHTWNVMIKTREFSWGMVAHLCFSIHAFTPEETSDSIWKKHFALFLLLFGFKWFLNFLSFCTGMAIRFFLNFGVVFYNVFIISGMFA